MHEISEMSAVSRWQHVAQSRRGHREMRRLWDMPYRQPGCTELLGTPAWLVDGRSFLDQCREIFGNQIYQFAARCPAPFILDGGANVGLATLYCKQMYPSSRIVAFEPDPGVFEALTRNCDQWRLAEVERVNAALWTRDGEQPFWAEGSDSGRLVAADGADAGATITVTTVRLREYLQGPVDLLKLDIEGAEAEVLSDCADCLGVVDHIFVEYHSLIGRPQCLDLILSILRSAGFRFYLQPQLLIHSPLVNHLEFRGLDQALNIFGWRE